MRISRFSTRQNIVIDYRLDENTFHFNRRKRGASMIQFFHDSSTFSDSKTDYYRRVDPTVSTGRWHCLRDLDAAIKVSPLRCKWALTLGAEYAEDCAVAILSSETCLSTDAARKGCTPTRTCVTSSWERGRILVENRRHDENIRDTNFRSVIRSFRYETTEEWKKKKKKRNLFSSKIFRRDFTSQRVSTNNIGWCIIIAALFFFKNCCVSFNSFTEIILSLFEKGWNTRTFWRRNNQQVERFVREVQINPLAFC